MHHDLIVLGAGISGASLAHTCARGGLEVLVAEKTNGLGGCLHSHRAPEGYWFELGAHTCYNSYRTLLELLEACGALDKVLPRAKAPFRLYADGKVRSLFSELKLWQLLAHAPRVFGARKEQRTVRDYYSALVGPDNYARVFGPLFAAVPSQPADEFPAEMLFKKRERRKELPRSFTLGGGLQTAVDVLLDSPKISVQLNAEATEVSRDGERYRVRFSDGAERTARFLALATPPDVGARLLAKTHPQIASELGRIAVTPVRSLGVVVKREATPLGPMTFLIPLGADFFSAVTRDPVPDPTWRGFTFHFPPSTTKDTALARIASVLRVDASGFEQVVEREVVLPSPRLGHAAIAQAIEGAVLQEPLAVTGNFFGGLAIEDCVLRSRAEGQRLLRLAGAAPG